MLIEAVLPQIRMFPWPQLKLPVVLGLFDVDPRIGKPLAAFRQVRVIGYLKEPIARRFSGLREGQQDFVLFVLAAEKRTSMTRTAERGLSNLDRPRSLHSTAPVIFTGPQANVLYRELRKNQAPARRNAFAAEDRRP